MVLTFLFVLFASILVFIIVQIRKSRQSESDKFAFFDELEASQFNVKLPPASDDYYVVKDKCIEKGWVPRQGKPSAEDGGK